MGVRELEEKKEELTLNINLLQVELTGFVQTSKFYETEIKNKIQRQNEIFEELKRLEREITDYDKLHMKFHNECVNTKWKQDKLKEEKDQIKEQIWNLRDKQNV